MKEPKSEPSSLERPEPERSKRSLLTSHVGWALVTGLALGFAIGREVGNWGASGDKTAPESTAGLAPDAKPGPTPATKPSTAGSMRVYASVADFPPDWLTHADVPAGLFTGLAESQKVAALQVLNQRDCECGCRFGTLASCLKNDPHCPRSPVLAGMIVGMAKKSLALEEILGAVDVAQAGMNRAEKARPAQGGGDDSARRRVELAAWNARKGPPAAKVTIVEFSDFQ